MWRNVPYMDPRGYMFAVFRQPWLPWLYARWLCLACCCRFPIRFVSWNLFSPWKKTAGMTRKPLPKWRFSNINCCNYSHWAQVEFPVSLELLCKANPVDGSLETKSSNHIGELLLPRKLTNVPKTKMVGSWKMILSCWNGSFLGNVR